MNAYGSRSHEVRGMFLFATSISLLSAVVYLVNALTRPQVFAVDDVSGAELMNSNASPTVQLASRLEVVTWLVVAAWLFISLARRPKASGQSVGRGGRRGWFLQRAQSWTRPCWANVSVGMAIVGLGVMPPLAAELARQQMLSAAGNSRPWVYEVLPLPLVVAGIYLAAIGWSFATTRRHRKLVRAD